MRVAIILAAVFLSCTSIVTRPNIRPFPQAAFDTVVADPAALADSARVAVASLGMNVRAFSAAEGYLETRWFDLETKRSHSGNDHPSRMVRLRVWTDLVTPRESQVVIETVLRRTIDPSVPDREVERVAEPGSSADSLTQAVRATVKRQFPAPRPVPASPSAR